MSVEDGDHDVSDLNLRIFIQERYGTRPQSWFQWLFEQIITHPLTRVGEIGCGPGTLWAFNAKAIPPGWRIVLTDVSPGMVQEAQAALNEIASRFAYCVADTSALPLIDSSLDLLLANGVLDVVTDLRKTLEETNRVLKPGGRILATTAGSSHLKELEELIAPFEPEVQLGRTSTQFTPENGETILSKRFTVLEQSTYDDVLTFDKITPILIYIRSEGNLMQRLSKQRYLAFVQRVQEEMKLRGEIRVRVEKVLFLARKQLA